MAAVRSEAVKGAVDNLSTAPFSIVFGTAWAAPAAHRAAEARSQTCDPNYRIGT